MIPSFLLNSAAQLQRKARQRQPRSFVLMSGLPDGCGLHMAVSDVPWIVPATLKQEAIEGAFT